MPANSGDLRVIVQAEKRDENKLHVIFADGVESIVPIDVLPISLEEIDLNTVEIRSNSIIIQRYDGEEEKVAWDVARRFGDPEFAREEEREDMRTRNKLGKHLKHIREEAGLTQDQLANMAEISRGTVNRIENGVNYPNSNTLRKLAEAVGVSFRELLSPSPQVDNEELREEVDALYQSEESVLENKFPAIPSFDLLKEVTLATPPNLPKGFKKLTVDYEDDRSLDYAIWTDIVEAEGESSNQVEFSGGPHA